MGRRTIRPVRNNSYGLSDADDLSPKKCIFTTEGYQEGGKQFANMFLRNRMRPLVVFLVATLSCCVVMPVERRGDVCDVPDFQTPVRDASVLVNACLASYGKGQGRWTALRKLDWLISGWSCDGWEGEVSRLRKEIVGALVLTDPAQGFYEIGSSLSEVARGSAVDDSGRPLEGCEFAGRLLEKSANSGNSRAALKAFEVHKAGGWFDGYCVDFGMDKAASYLEMAYAAGDRSAAIYIAESIFSYGNVLSDSPQSDSQIYLRALYDVLPGEMRVRGAGWAIALLIDAAMQNNDTAKRYLSIIYSSPSSGYFMLDFAYAWGALSNSDLPRGNFSSREGREDDLEMACRHIMAWTSEYPFLTFVRGEVSDPLLLRCAAKEALLDEWSCLEGKDLARIRAALLDGLSSVE